MFRFSKKTLFFGAFCICFCNASKTAFAQQEQVDLILHNAFVWTVDATQPQAEAVAVRGKKIIRVGNNAEVLKLRSENQRVID